MKRLFFALSVPALLAACEEGGGSDTASQADLTPAQQACLRDVSATTNNADVAVLSSQFSEAGTLVIVGVGPDRARWNCVAYSDGTTDGIESLTDEGT